MTDTLRDRIKEEVLDGILSMFSENDSVEMAAGYITDAVIRELGRQDCGCVPIFPKSDSGGQTKQYGPSPKIATRRTRNEGDDE